MPENCPLKIIHVTPVYLPAVRYGGPVYVISGLCRALKEAGHDVSVLTTDNGGESRLTRLSGKTEQVDGVPVTYCPGLGPEKIAFAPAMKKYFEGMLHGADMVHVHCAYSWFPPAAASLAARQGIPYIFSPHGSLTPVYVARKSTFAKKLWLRLWGRKLFQRAACLLAASKAEAQGIAEGGYCKKKPLETVPFGYDFPERLPVRQNRVRSGHERVLLFLGRLDPVKRIDLVIESLKHLPECRLVLAGSPEPRYEAVLHKKAAVAGVATRITFTGAVHGSEKARLFESADVFVLPSLAESFGYVLLEALSAGLPVVTVPEVGMAEAVRRLGLGKVVGPDPVSLASAVRSCLRDAGLKEYVAGEGQAALQREFAWKEVALQMEGVYRKYIELPHKRVAAVKESRYA